MLQKELFYELNNIYKKKKLKAALILQRMLDALHEAAYQIESTTKKKETPMGHRLLSLDILTTHYLDIASLNAFFGS